jgi:hypothetical protein
MLMSLRDFRGTMTVRLGPMRKPIVLFGASALLLLVGVARAAASVWQWSVPVEGGGRAFLWIPETCERVRAVLLAQHNMIERGILEHAAMRQAMAELGIAEVFIVPSIDPVFQFHDGAGARFDAILGALAEDSGYDEIASVPIVPMGHSAHASFPWNYAASNPERTLAALSLKGDAPLTDLTGSGRPNPEWGKRTLDGIPGLMVMSEFEWWEARLAPLQAYRAAHPAAPLALLADTGHGHFDATDPLVDFLVLFLRKAAALRLPEAGSGGLRAVDPQRGWLVDRWRGDEPPRALAAAFSTYTGDRAEALWCFDEEMARATEEYHARTRGKQVQRVAFRQGGEFVPISNTHAAVELAFLPEADGLTFRLESSFITPLPPNPPVATKDQRPPVTTVVPTLAAAGTYAPGVIEISAITGPVEEISPGMFRVALSRMFSTLDRRAWEVWFLARHPGNERYRGAVQQALLRLPHFTEGVEQTITFPAIADQELGTAVVALEATSDRGLPVGYYVREGPAIVRYGNLHLTALPRRAKQPVKVTVVAWQFGQGTSPKTRAAAPVMRTFLVTRP